MKKRYITLNPNTDNWFFDSYDDCRVFRGFTYNSLLDSAPNGLLKGMPLYVAIKTRLGDLCIYLLQNDYFIGNRFFDLWLHNDPSYDYWEDVMILHHDECLEGDYGVTEEELGRLTRARDSVFTFEDIDDAYDVLQESQSISYIDNYKSGFKERVSAWAYYSGETFESVFDTSPLYLIGLLNSNRIFIDESVLSQLDCSNPFFKKLEEAIFARIASRREEEKDEWDW